MQLTWHNYRYYPYERVLAEREAKTILHGTRFSENDCGLKLAGTVNIEDARRLTYFAGLRDGSLFVETIQSQLECAERAGKNRQPTRYSVHGLHEYKGKFNPQVAKAILNIFGSQKGGRILDPFCGSGTTLVECAHLGAIGYGTDLNPLAIFIANAKLQALAIPAAMWRQMLSKLSSRLRRITRWSTRIADDPRTQYLESWFDRDVLQVIEIIRIKTLEVTGHLAPVFLAVASNLLRDYSQQDPKDLRIRRRKSPLPETPFIEAFLKACDIFIGRIEDVQSVLGVDFVAGKAVLQDVNTLTLDDVPYLFDAAITSPPYAMALPYIDTQRLSLVWLGLLPASHILQLEADLIGSREIRGGGRHRFEEDLIANTADLPSSEAEFCIGLQKAISPKDGFRRKAVPLLLYRYFKAMRDSFVAVRRVLKAGAPFALIVGHNHTVLGGIRYDINTPLHLMRIAMHVGWKREELIELQTYQRYGYHMNNAVAAETLLILKNI